MLLGIGGVRALQAMHQPVDLYHFNEGHAVFAGLELIADRMEAGMEFEAARHAVRASIVFTTHTPVPAGNETHALADLRRLGADCDLLPAELARHRRRPLQHDGGGAAPRPPRQRGGAAARRDRAGDVGRRGGRGAHHRHHQRGPRGHVAGPARARCPRERRRPPCHPPRDEGRAARRGRAAHRHASGPRRAHHRLRPPRRHLQAARPPLARPRAARSPPQGPPRPAAVRGQGPSRRRRGEGGDRPPGGDHPPVAGIHRLPRELRHGAGPPAHAGL